MERAEYIKSLYENYVFIKAKINTEDKKVMVFRHKSLGRDMIVRSYNYKVPVYEFLCEYLHDNIPQIYDVYNASDSSVVLEEYIDGMNVEEILETGLYNYTGAKSVMKQVCSALSFLHAHGIVHRDIKPENVMVQKDGICKLIDYDVSRRINGTKSKDTDVLGTIGFAPPEQYGIAQSDSRSDIYALGVMLNIMLTGKHPSEQIADGKAGRIITKCTQINPGNRYNSVKEFEKAL